MPDLALTLAAFAGFAALATLAQNATGFAFSLVLLGLSGLTGQVPLADAANAASLLTLWQALLQRVADPPAAPGDAPGPWLWPLLIGSLPGLAVGVALLAWLSAQALPWLQALLGAVVLVSAVRMARPRPRRRQLSSWRALWATGALSGLLGGLFATAGPPLVLQMYRQPLPLAALRRGLLQVFALQAGLRLGLVLWSGGLHWPAAWLALAAMPAVAGTQWLGRWAWPRVPDARARHGVVALLALTGAALLLQAGRG